MYLSANITYLLKYSARQKLIHSIHSLNAVVWINRSVCLCVFHEGKKNMKVEVHEADYTQTEWTRRVGHVDKQTGQAWADRTSRAAAAAAPISGVSSTPAASHRALGRNEDNYRGEGRKKFSSAKNRCIEAK